MPFLNAAALTDDSDGMAFLAAVIGTPDGEMISTVRAFSLDPAAAEPAEPCLPSRFGVRELAPVEVV